MMSMQVSNTVTALTVLPARETNTVLAFFQTGKLNLSQNNIKKLFFKLYFIV